MLSFEVYKIFQNNILYRTPVDNVFRRCAEPIKTNHLRQQNGSLRYSGVVI